MSGDAAPSQMEQGDNAQTGMGATGIAVLDKLAALEIQRKNDRAKRREEAKDKLDPRESAQTFLSNFSSQRTEIETVLDELTQKGSVEGTDASKALQERLDQLAAQLFNMDKQV